MELKELTTLVSVGAWSMFIIAVAVVMFLIWNIFHRSISNEVFERLNKLERSYSEIIINCDALRKIIVSRTISFEEEISKIYRSIQSVKSNTVESFSSARKDFEKLKSIVTAYGESLSELEKAVTELEAEQIETQFDELMNGIKAFLKFENENANRKPKTKKA